MKIIKTNKNVLFVAILGMIMCLQVSASNKGQGLVRNAAVMQQTSGALKDKMSGNKVGAIDDDYVMVEESLADKATKLRLGNLGKNITNEPLPHKPEVINDAFKELGKNNDWSLRTTSYASEIIDRLGKLIAETYNDHNKAWSTLNARTAPTGMINVFLNLKNQYLAFIRAMGLYFGPAKYKQGTATKAHENYVLAFSKIQKNLLELNAELISKKYGADNKTLYEKYGHSLGTMSVNNQIAEELKLIIPALQARVMREKGYFEKNAELLKKIYQKNRSAGTNVTGKFQDSSVKVPDIRNDYKLDSQQKRNPLFKPVANSAIIFKRNDAEYIS